MMAIGLVGKPVDSCFEEAEKTGKLMLPNRNLRELPNSCDKYDMEDVFAIDLCNNKLKKVPNVIRKCMILTRLNLHNNFLREFSPDLKNLPSLKELVLSRNSLTGFPHILTTYKLELLDISCNQLKTVPEDIRFLDMLKVLDLSSNSIRALPSTIGQLGNLRCLNMSRNKLECVPEELQYCPLMKLNLSFNKLHMIPPSFRHLIGLQEINLESNPLKHPPAKICSLGKAHIFKYLSLLASHMEAKSDLSQEEIEMQKRYREAQERLPYRPDSAIKTPLDDFDIYPYSPTFSHTSLHTPSITTFSDFDSRITTPDIQEGGSRIDSSSGPDYTSMYMNYVRRDHNASDDVEVGFGRYSPDPATGSILRQRSAKKADGKRRSSHYDTEQKPVLSMYATIPRSFRRPTTPTGDCEESSIRIQHKVRPVLRMSPYMRRPLENSGSEEYETGHPVLSATKSSENSTEAEGHLRIRQKQMNQVFRAESTRSSSTTGTYFGAPFSYAVDLKRSTSNKYINRTPEAILADKNRTKTSNPSNESPPERPPSPVSDSSTVSDTPTPTASPEPPTLIISLPQKQEDVPPPPPPRTFTATPQFGLKGQVAKLSFEKGNPIDIYESDKFFKSKKPSESDEPDGGSMTIRRREYNLQIMTSQIDYILKEVKDRLGLEVENFENYIQDGVLACQLINLVHPDLLTVNVPQKNRVLSTIQVTLNIEKFIEGCQQLGVPTNYMCTAADIIHGQDLSKVCKNFIYLLNSSSV